MSATSRSKGSPTKHLPKVRQRKSCSQSTENINAAEIALGLYKRFISSRARSAFSSGLVPVATEASKILSSAAGQLRLYASTVDIENTWKIGFLYTVTPPSTNSNDLS